MPAVFASVVLLTVAAAAPQSQSVARSIALGVSCVVLFVLLPLGGLERVARRFNALNELEPSPLVRFCAERYRSALGGAFEPVVRLLLPRKLWSPSSLQGQFYSLFKDARVSWFPPADFLVDVVIAGLSAGSARTTSAEACAGMRYSLLCVTGAYLLL